MSRVLKAPDVLLDQDGHGQGSASPAFQSAIAEAFSRGREAGATEATAQLEHQVAQLREQLTDQAASLRSVVEAHVSNDAEAIVNLSLDLAGWFLSDATLANPAAITASLQPALEQLVDETGIVLYLHPDVVELLGQGGIQGVTTVRSDPSLEASDFRLTSDGRTVERRWRDSLSDLRPELSAALRLSGRAEAQQETGGPAHDQ